MKKRISKLFAVILALSAIAVAVPKIGTVNTKAESYGKIVNRKEVAIEVDGLSVKTTSAWKQGSDTKFSVNVGKIAVEDDGYLAINLKLAKVNYDYFVCRLGVNGKLFDMGDAGTGGSAGNSYKAVSNGTTINVNQKFGYFFNFPKGFDGTIYIPAELVGVDGERVSEVTELNVSVDSSYTERQSNIVWNRVYACKEVGDAPETAFEFSELLSSDDGSVNDYRFACTSNLECSIEKGTYTDYACDGAMINEEIGNALRVGINKTSACGEELTGADLYSWLKIDLKDRSFTPKDGLAVKIYGYSSSVSFKLYLETENGAKYKPNISETSTTGTFRFVTVNGEVSTVGARLGNVYVLRGKSGTLYIPYADMTPITKSSEFMGETPVKAEGLNKVTAIYIGMRYLHSNGKYVAIGSFANVDVKKNEVTEIINTAKLSDEELNVNDITSGAVIKALGEGQRIVNWNWGKFDPRLLPEYRDFEGLKNLIEACKRIDESKYTEESLKILKDKIIVAELMLENDFASTSDVERTYKDLSKAKFELERKGGGCNGNAYGGTIIVSAAAIAIAALLAKIRRKSYD